MAREQDILQRRPPKRPPRLTSRRIGIHTSSAGGVQNAAERAYRLGCNTFQIFSSSPRQWAPYELGELQCAEMNRLRAHYDLKPLVIHTNYLVNLASSNELFLHKSMEAFRGEVMRALSLCAEYLVLHPGSFRGADREQGLLRTAAAIAASTQGLDLAAGGLTILIENTAGCGILSGRNASSRWRRFWIACAEWFRLARASTRATRTLPDTTLSAQAGLYETLQHLDSTIGLNPVKVWHCNDAKAARGSKLDRHQQIGKGTIGEETFRVLLNDLRLAHAAFIAETPIDRPGDDRRNIESLKNLVAKT